MMFSLQGLETRKKREEPEKGQKSVKKRKSKSYQKRLVEVCAGKALGMAGQGGVGVGVTGNGCHPQCGEVGQWLLFTCRGCCRCRFQASRHWSDAMSHPT